MMIEVPNRHEKKTAFHTAYIYTQRAPRRPCLAASHPGLAVPASHTRTLSPTTHMAGFPNGHLKLVTLDEVTTSAGWTASAIAMATAMASAAAPQLWVLQCMYLAGAPRE